MSLMWTHVQHTFSQLVSQTLFHSLLYSYAATLALIGSKFQWVINRTNLSPCKWVSGHAGEISRRG